MLSEKNFVSLVLECWLLIFFFSLFREFLIYALKSKAGAVLQSRVAVLVGWGTLHGFSNSTKFCLWGSL